MKHGRLENIFGIKKKIKVQDKRELKRSAEVVCGSEFSLKLCACLLKKKPVTNTCKHTWECTKYYQHHLLMACKFQKGHSSSSFKDYFHITISSGRESPGAYLYTITSFFYFTNILWCIQIFTYDIRFSEQRSVCHDPSGNTVSVFSLLLWSKVLQLPCLHKMEKWLLQLWPKGNILV